jgi:hypothetical protein
MKRLLLALLALLVTALQPGWAQDAPRLFFSKAFPGSRPPYMEIRLERDGSVEYREGPNEDDPITYKLTPHEVETVFLLSDKVDHFQRELESGLKVARMGDKVLRWEKGAEKHEVKFNYTLDPDGGLIYDWFERMCESAFYYIELERAAKFDKLGVNQAILKLESAWDRHRLVGVEQYLKLLDRIAKNESYLNMARERAAKLAEVFRNPPAETAAGGDKPDGKK